MDFSTLFEHFDSLISWKFLVTATFTSYTSLGLYFLPFFHDILHDMFNYIVYSCIGFSILILCKIGFQIHDFISRKLTLKREKI